MSILKTVKGCPLFQELYDAEILDIVKHCQVINLRPQDTIFRKGDTGNEVYLVLSGQARVSIGDVELAKLKKGDLFGEMVLLKENIRKADIVCDTFSSVLVIDYDDLFNYFQKNKNVFSILMLNLARILAGRLKKAGGQIKELCVENDKLKRTQLEALNH